MEPVGEVTIQRGDVKIKFTTALQKSMPRYTSGKKFDDELIGMFTRLAEWPGTWKEASGEVLVLDARTNVPILSIQPLPGWI